MAGKKEAAKKEEARCWPGYEPVKGKPANSQGSCRPKAESELSESEKEFRHKRRAQLDEWQAEHPHTRKSAAQHLHAPGATSGPKPKSSKADTAKGKKRAKVAKTKSAKQ
jgi:hypothetical protein